MKKQDAPEFKIEAVDVDDLKRHPRNYRAHPKLQVEHLVKSIKDHGFYKNIVVAKDLTILAGHGVIEAAKKMGLKRVPVVRVNVAPDDPRALRILTGDNEIGRLGEIDDRALSEILKEIKDADVEGLMGTGYDAQQLANLIFVTRPASEIKDIDEASHYVGMPEFGDSEKPIHLVVSFRSEEDREEFIKKVGLKIMKKEAKSWSTWWPEKVRDDAAAVRFEDGGEKK